MAVNKKQVTYTVIYGCIVFTFPEVPLKGIQFIGDAIGGFLTGFYPPFWSAVKSWLGSEIKDIIFS